MPFRYDFLCTRCAAEFEAKAPHDQRQAPCVVCGAPADRQFSVTDPDRIRFWRERWEVTRSQVCAPVKRTQWRGVEGPR